MKRNSATFYLLSAFIPYTSANLSLAFVPSRFFAELARRHNVKLHTLEVAYKRSVTNGLVRIDTQGTPNITKKGQRALAPFVAKKLPGAVLMVIFDIPEEFAYKRRLFRQALTQFKFKQVQKSVWVTKLDCITFIEDTLDALSINEYVEIYEAVSRSK